jgi:hypothetical protein
MHFNDFVKAWTNDGEVAGSGFSSLTLDDIGICIGVALIYLSFAVT